MCSPLTPTACSLDCQNAVSDGLSQLNSKYRLLVLRESPLTILPKLFKAWKISISFLRTIRIRMLENPTMRFWRRRRKRGWRVLLGMEGRCGIVMTSWVSMVALYDHDTASESRAKNRTTPTANTGSDLHPAAWRPVSEARIPG